MLKLLKSTLISCGYGLFFIVCLSFSGCGYTTSSTLPSGIKTIYITPIKNKIDYASTTKRKVYLPLLEVDVRNAIIDRFLFDGNLKIAEKKQADLILMAELLSYERSGLRFDDNDNVQEYRIHVTISMSLLNANRQEEDWSEASFSGEADYFVSGAQAKSELSAVTDAVNDLARRVVERTVENW